MNLNQLQCFVSFAASGSVSQSAKQLNISQPALSATLRRLENETGIELFRRTGRSLKLTENGERFARIANSLITTIEHTNRTAALTGELSQERVVITARSSELLLAASLAGLLADSPNVLLHIRSNNVLPGDVSGMVGLDHSIVFHLSSKLREHVGRSYLLLTTLRQYFVIPANHPLAEKPELTAADLQKARFVFCCPGSRKIPQAYYDCINSGFIPDICAITDNRFDLLGLLYNGDAITLCPEPDARMLARIGGFVCRPFLTERMQAAERLIYLSWKPGPLNEASQLLLQKLMDAYHLTEEDIRQPIRSGITLLH
ncbi:MAG: LysR family transcriptional regulator [Clostridium sp.]|nr:LysR family transcriptional regulator [Clostridium sp.]